MAFGWDPGKIKIKKIPTNGVKWCGFTNRYEMSNAWQLLFFLLQILFFSLWGGFFLYGRHKTRLTSGVAHTYVLVYRWFWCICFICATILRLIYFIHCYLGSFTTLHSLLFRQKFNWSLDVCLYRYVCVIHGIIWLVFCVVVLFNVLVVLLWIHWSTLSKHKNQLNKWTNKIHTIFLLSFGLFPILQHTYRVHAFIQNGVKVKKKLQWQFGLLAWSWLTFRMSSLFLWSVVCFCGQFGYNQ